MAFPFFGFRIMVGIALLMLAVVATGIVLMLHRGLFLTAWYLRLSQWVAPLGFVAVLAGWITTETDRQPWTVYGLLRTAGSNSPSLTGGDVLGSLIAYDLVYLIMFPTGIAFLAGRVRAGVGLADGPDAPVEGLQPRAPVKRAPVKAPPEPAPAGE